MECSDPVAGIWSVLMGLSIAYAMIQAGPAYLFGVLCKLWDEAPPAVVGCTWLMVAICGVGLFAAQGSEEPIAASWNVVWQCVVFWLLGLIIVPAFTE